MSLKLGIAHPPMSYIWRGGALENHQNLCHKNLTSSLIGCIGYIVLSKDEAKLSESCPFTPQANRFWPSVLENSSLAGILDQGAVSFQGA